MTRPDPTGPDLDRGLIMLYCYITSHVFNFFLSLSFWLFPHFVFFFSFFFGEIASRASWQGRGDGDGDGVQWYMYGMVWFRPG